MAFPVRAAFTIFCLAAAPLVRAADMCPAPPKYQAPIASDIAADDHRIHIDSDDALLDADGNAVLNGRVKVRQDARTVTSDSVNYDDETGRVTVKGGVDFEDPKLRVRSDAGHYDINGAANFDQANFQLMDRNGRGFAKDIDVLPDGKLRLERVRYTSCPVGNEDWMLQASAINLDTKLQEGVARNVTMRFKDVPIFYTPYISFPLGDERKSGLLFPSFGHSGNNGFELEVPYYFNLAPNYDLTLTPGLLSARGVQIAGQFRYLSASSHGQLDTTFLPNDAQEHGDRSYFRFTDITDFKQGMRFDTDIASVSDSKYFEDFAVGSDQTSVTFLERRADLLYYDDAWRVRGELQNFQTIDITVPTTCAAATASTLPAALCDQRPYSRVPRIQANALWPVPNTHVELALDSEAVNFVREVGPTGARFNVAPEIRWSSRGRGYFFEPAVGYDFTQYDLKNAAAGGLNAPSTPTRALPYARVDTGLVFERDAGSQGQRTQTLEPRVVYSYVPYRNQDELPIFDSGLPDLNLTELFRTNRYVGEDRIGDANQAALALTTRLFDHVSGAQYLSATIGQIRYFAVPRVGLPDVAALASSGQTLVTLPGVNPLAMPGQAVVNSRGQIIMAIPGQYVSGLPSQSFATLGSGQAAVFPASDIVADVAVTAYKHFSFNFDYLWNPYTAQTDKSEVSLQYRPDPTRVVNLGYRFQQNVLNEQVILKQWDGSFAWPIAQHWNTVGRWVYSLQDRKTIEQVAGFEYKSCCYRIQVVQRRYITNRAGGLDTSIALQLELTGLSSVGKRADSFLEQSIRGYSTRDPNAQNQAP
ncbi:MAG: LPS-assembly protein [Gammaproteobacteria bacterium]|jgi:LPS-assembly protein|nr:LPS-assembly protein [Gammaproteobacteria bacterium]